MKKSRFSSNRGSALIVALLISAIIAVSLASYMQLSRTSMTMSNRALYSNAAMNLAENGLEEAMYSINQSIADSTYSWTSNGWTISPSSTADVRRTLPASGTYNFDQNATGHVRVYVYGYAGTAPTAIARSTVTLAGTTGPPIEKWVQISLRKTSKFANGLVAKDSITFRGNNASVDSWNSEKLDDGTLRGSPVGYSAGVAHDKGSVGSISVSVNSVAVQNADIWGYAATGGALPSVGSNGLIGPYGTASGTMDMNRVSTDFSASFDPVSAPTQLSYNLGAITSNTSLPRLLDLPRPDGKYYYEAARISFNNKTLAINSLGNPKVVITLTDPGTSINVGGGSGSIEIASGSTLEIYAPGDIKIAGNGVLNGGNSSATANQSKDFQIWGTKTAGVQDIEISGNGVLSALVYAPQGSVKINGNGDVMGSVIANDITLVGNAAFHYDESLADLDAGNPFRISRWRELTSEADRAAYQSALTW